MLWRLRKCVSRLCAFFPLHLCPRVHPLITRQYTTVRTGDLHTINGGWGKKILPLCVGHEIVGKVIKTGPKVTLCKVGDRVGVGAQIRACLECKVCKSDNENYCPNSKCELSASFLLLRDGDAETVVCFFW